MGSTQVLQSFRTDSRPCFAAVELAFQFPSERAGVEYKSRMSVQSGMAKKMLKDIRPRNLPPLPVNWKAALDWY